jgi:1-deoxy-D-xylulose-5-phosphate reductoisomerase
MKRVAVLGSTGSIGTSCLRVVQALRDRLTPVALTAHRRWELLRDQCRQHRPNWCVIGDAGLKSAIPAEDFPPQTELLFGPEAIERIAGSDEIDVVIAGIVGAAGLRSTWAAVESGKTVGIANKETLVVAGPLVMDLAAKTGATLIPVDSEHSAIFQALHAGVGGRRSEVGGRRSAKGGKRKAEGGQTPFALDSELSTLDSSTTHHSPLTTHHSPLTAGPEVRRIVLTASGGPFRGWTKTRLENVTPQMALSHPTWNMGPKITIDSATLMNKALEIIEARWLFGLSPEQVQVVVHPQSVVHSFVEFVDGSVIAQLSPPDMMLPIQYALTYPERTAGPSPRLDWETPFSLEFSPPDCDAFPALELGFEVARRGGSCGAVLNAANEIAVERFLAGTLRFVDIPQACRAVLDAHDFDPKPTLAELLRLDAQAREETRRWV